MGVTAMFFLCSHSPAASLKNIGKIWDALAKFYNH